jgi:hypothetical protein
MSKLGFHISAGNHRGLAEALKKCADARNFVRVIFSLDQNVWADTEKFSPQTVVIFRTQKNGRGKSIGDGPGSMYKGDPVQTARDWMVEMMPVWAKNKAHYYAPLNEQDPSTLKHFAWINTFTIECMKIAEANNYRLALYAFSGGCPKDLLNPELASQVIATQMQCWDELVPSLRYAMANGHILLLHEYGFGYGPLKKSAPWLALRYRKVYQHLPVDARPFLVISEASAGAGFGGNPQVWLDDAKWYDSEIMKDKVVLGCCLYQLGGAENFVTALPQLADYISQTPTPLVQYDPVVPPDITSEKYRVVYDHLNVHLDPETYSQVRCVKSRGDILDVLETKIGSGYEWGRTIEGWVTLRQIPQVYAEKING